NVIFTNSWVDAPLRFYFERHVLGIGQSTKTDVDAYLARFFDEDGSEPVHYIQFADVDKAAFDKHLYGIFVHDQKWEWIADPTPHKAEILSFLQKRSATPDR
ncbi:hypothetical protein G6O46_25265, partial [Salmonella enterica subsp. enterica serovar Enteritidis]|uniref:hypothetical protein n=1 Tax=Salmonella enterica TaxID=28901 RepID=UPI001654A2F6